jgi:aspartyl protease family protein
VSSVLKLAIIATVAMLSGAIGAEAVLALANPAPTLRAAKAESLNSSLGLGAQAPGAVAIPKSPDGHYWANGQVNGASVRFLVDTGATAVALTPADAQRLGLRPADLHYGSSVVTAAGQTRAAAVKLASITVAGARLENVDALVIEKGLDTSLLGMTYLGRLAGFQATRQALVLQP